MRHENRLPACSIGGLLISYLSTDIVAPDEKVKKVRGLLAQAPIHCLKHRYMQQRHQKENIMGRARDASPPPLLLPLVGIAPNHYLLPPLAFLGAGVPENIFPKSIYNHNVQIYPLYVRGQEPVTPHLLGSTTTTPICKPLFFILIHAT